MEWPGQEPDEVVLSFLARLPDTIRESVLAGCILAFDLTPDLVQLVQFDPFAELRDFVQSESAIRRSYRTAMLIAAVALSLEHEPGDAQSRFRNSC